MKKYLLLILVALTSSLIAQTLLTANSKGILLAELSAIDDDSTTKNVISLEADPTDYNHPKEFVLAPIAFEGADSLNEHVLALVTGLNPGEKIKIPGDKLKLAIDNLWKQGLFENIQIYADKFEGNTIFLKIYVVKRPRIKTIEYKGISKSNREDINEKLKLKPKSVYTDFTEGHIVNTIKEFYQDKGYRNVKVTSSSRKVDDEYVVPIFTINKGKKVRIKKIIIDGNTAVKDWKLQMAMKETKPKRWWNPFNSGKYLEDNLEKDKPAIIEKFTSRGFRDAQIVKDSVYEVSPSRVNIYMKIEEGKKYYFRHITWIGNTKYSSQYLSSILNIKKGSIFDQALLDSRLYMNPTGADISSLYMDNGYLFFNVTPTEVLVEKDSIDLEIRLYEGKPAIVNKVTVNGNTKTNDRVIYREIRTRPGQLFRRSDVIRTQRELGALGYFDQEKMQVNPLPNPQNGTVDIEYVVEEKPSDQIELSGGFGGGRIVGTAGISFSNFSLRNVLHLDTWKPLPAGDGQKLSFRAQSNGRWYQSYNFSFTEPWLGGRKPNSLSFTTYFTSQALSDVAIFIKNSEGKRVRNPARQYMDILGVAIGLGNRLKKPDDFFTLYNELNYQHYILNNFYGNFILTNGEANSINWKTVLSRSSVDSKVNQMVFPETGSVITLTSQLTPPYSLFNGKDYTDISNQERYKYIEYAKFKLTANWFTNLTAIRSKEGKIARNLILSTKIGFGFLGMYNKKVGVSPFERFYLGGSGLTGFGNFLGQEIIALRGYREYSSSAPSVSSKDGDPFITKMSWELRYPISTNPQATIFMLGFVDAGNTWSKIKDVNPFALKRSAGVGLRVFLPMFGLLGFDYGWRFDDIPNVPMAKSLFHFTIGFQTGDL